MKSERIAYVIFIFLVFIFLHLPTALLNAQDRDNCQDFRVYGDDTHQNYIQLSTGSNARIIYFDEVTVRKTGNSGYLVCFPVFGIAPVMQGNENMDPVSLMRMANAEDIDHRMSKINLLISPGTNDPYFFPRSSISSIDCVIDGNRFNPSLEDLLDPQSSNMEHNISRDGDKLIMDFTSVSKEDATFSMQLHIEAESIPEKVLEDNFRAEISEDTLKARIYLYSNAGLLTYETRFGLEKVVKLPEDGSMRSGYIEKDFAKVFEFESLTAGHVRFRVHNVKRTSGDKYESAIMDPLQSAGTTPGDLHLNSETYGGTVVAAELVEISGDPVLVDHSILPEEEQFYAYPIQLDIHNKEVGLNDLPANQAFSLSSDLEAFSYTLVNPHMRSVEVTASETPDQYLIDIKRGNMEDFVSDIQFHGFLEEAGAYADAVTDFILHLAENYNELKEKDLAWWEGELETMGVEPPDSDNPGDFMKAVEDQYDLNNRIVRLLTENHFSEKYGELLKAYAMITRMKSDRADTASYADQVLQLAAGMGIDGLEHQDWIMMVGVLEDSMRQKYPEYVISWALKSAGKTVDPVTRFTFTTDKEGRARKAEYLSPSGYGRLKFTYRHNKDSVRLGISHPRQESEHRSFPVGEGIPDVHYLFTLLPWYDYNVDLDKDYYFMNLKGTTYGRNFYITPVFYHVNLLLRGGERITFIDREIATYKLLLTFNTVPERPAILFSELTGTGGRQPVAEIWVTQEQPHIPVKMKVGSEIYWQGPASADPALAGDWYEWFMKKPR